MNNRFALERLADALRCIAQLVRRQFLRDDQVDFNLAEFLVQDRVERIGDLGDQAQAVLLVQHAHELQEQYLLVSLHEQNASRLSDIVVKIMHSISIIFGTTGISIKKARPYFEMLRQGSDELQAFLNSLVNESIITSLWQPLLQSQITHFLSYKYIYLLENEPVATEIENVHAIISAVQEHYNNSILLIKKALLEMMLPAWDR